MPALGGKISTMEVGGRDWLWRSDVIPYAAPVDGASYAETADSGGFDECFPTVGACRLGPDAQGWAGLELPDHGELWSQRPTVEVATPDDGATATLAWVGRRMPYRLTRTIRLTSAGAVEMRYAATNGGRVALPYLWSSHPLLPLTPTTRVVLREGTPLRVWAQHGIDIGGPGAEHRWPHIRGKQRIYDLSRPDAAASRYACKLFFDMQDGEASIEQDGARLTARFDLAEVPQLGLWLNRRGWTPFRGRSRYMNLAFEPCIGAPDTLSDALGSWKRAQWLEPGETREWGVTWTGIGAGIAG